MNEKDVNTSLETMSEAFFEQQGGTIRKFSESIGLLPAEQGAPVEGAPPAELMVSKDLKAVPSGEPDKRKRRRQQWEQDQEIKRRWELHRKLADISTEVDLLSREVTKVRAELHVPLPALAALPDFERQTLESAHSRRLSDIIYIHAKKALNTVTGHKWSWPFNAPVDINIYKDYLEKVETPMDFGSIKRKLDAKEYTHPDALLTDVRLVFNNAKAYNKPGSDVHVMAVTLAEKFEEKYTAIVAGRVTEENTVAEAEAMAARRRYAGAAAAAGGAQREAAEARSAFLVKYLDQVSTCIADAKSAAAAQCKQVTRQEKESLALALGKLPQHEFEAAVAIVMHHHPGLQPFEEVVFDLDMLDALTLRQLMSYIAAAEVATDGGIGGGSRAVDQPPSSSTGKGCNEQSGNIRVNWPAVPLGSGMRHFTGKRKRRTVGGGGNGNVNSGGAAAKVDRATTPASDPGTTETTPGLDQEIPASGKQLAEAAEKPVQQKASAQAQRNGDGAKALADAAQK